MKMLKKLLSNNRGNVSLLFALSAVPMIAVVGGAVDYISSSRIHVKTANATDAALLAISSSVVKEVDLKDAGAVKAKFDADFEKYFLRNFSTSATPRAQYKSHTVQFDPVTGKVRVDVKVDYDTTFLKVLGHDKVNIKVHSAANLHKTEIKGALSMYLVLDRSGSMGWNYPTRMTSLKTAVNDMVTNLKIADSKKKYIRMGAVAYDSSTWKETKLRWNLNKANAYVQAMSPSGGTNSSGGVAKAYQELKNPKEITKHGHKNGLIPKLVMVFMTDGNNNASSYDTSTINTCNQAKSYGVEIYTVAFQAPSSGQQLLNNCASDSNHYFEPENTNELIEVFNKIGSSVSEGIFLSE